MPSISKKPSVAIVLNATWNIVNFRSGLVKELVASGFDVVALAPPDDHVDDLLSLGCRFVSVPMDSNGTNPVRDLMLFFRLLFVLASERPSCLLCFTIKPNIYASIVGSLLNIPVVNTITGLGTAFIKNSWVTAVVRRLYKFALRKSVVVFFQNQDDRDLFLQLGLVASSKTDLVPGSGISLTRFKPVPLCDGPRLRFLLVGRLLWDKGVGEFVEAASILKAEGIDADFSIVGGIDPNNPAAITKTQVDEWVAKGSIHYLGTSNQIEIEIGNSDCVVLPSYREGTPRTLLEAAAMGRPIVATDAVGCREVVSDGENGYLCKVADANDLALKLKLIYELPRAALESMGNKGRLLVEARFDEKLVIHKYLSVLGRSKPL